MLEYCPAVLEGADVLSLVHRLDMRLQLEQDEGAEPKYMDLLRKGKAYHIARLKFNWVAFNQLSDSVFYIYIMKPLNQNQASFTMPNTIR